MYVLLFKPTNSSNISLPHHNNVALVILVVIQFALCHVGSHLLLFISACIWRVQFGAPRCRSLLRKQQRTCPWTHSLVSSTLVPPITQTRTDVRSSLTVCPTSLLVSFHQQISCRSRNQLRCGPVTRRNGKWRFQFRHGRCRSESSWLMPYGHSEEFQRTAVGTKWSVGDPQSSSDAVRHESCKCSPSK